MAAPVTTPKIESDEISKIEIPYEREKRPEEKLLPRTDYRT
jgi:hypothetical protein